MNVAVGSQNPVKIQAAERVTDRLYSGAAVEAFAVDSGVSEMPTSWKEAADGASNRAENALAEGEHRLGLGMEGYTMERGNDMYLSNWCVAVDTEQGTGHGGGELIPLPDHIADRIRAGEELGPVIDDVLGREEVRKEEGTIGVLTDGQVTRQEAFEHALSCALAPITQTEHYRGGER